VIGRYSPSWHLTAAQEAPGHDRCLWLVSSLSGDQHVPLAGMICQQAGTINCMAAALNARIDAEIEPLPRPG
jgi:hypothetical protein